MRAACTFGLAVTLPTTLQGVNFRPELNAQMPLDAAFKDETGKDVHLRDYLHEQKPVVVAFVYYGCPMMCTQLEQGVVGAWIGGVVVQAEGDVGRGCLAGVERIVSCQSSVVSCT